MGQMNRINRAKVIEEVRTAVSDLCAAEGVAGREYLTDREYLDALRPIVRHAHRRVVEIYKEIVAGYGRVREAGAYGAARHFAPAAETVDEVLAEK